jgi:hypothetical protein
VQLLNAQNNAIDKYYRDFQNKSSLDVVTISKKMLPLLIENKKGKEKDDLTIIINKLTELKMLSKTNPFDGDNLFSSANSLLPKEYESILAMNEKDRKVRCYTLESSSGKISELLMVAFQWGRFMVLSITGKIELNEIYKLTQSLNFGSLSQQQLRNE